MNKVMEIFYKLFPPPLDPLKAAIESIDFALEPLTPVEPTGDEHIYFEDFLMPAFSIHAFVPMQSQEEEKEKEEGEKDEKKDKKSHGLSALLGAGTISSVLNVVAGDLDQTFLLFKNTRSRRGKRKERRATNPCSNNDLLISAHHIWRASHRQEICFFNCTAIDARQNVGSTKMNPSPKATLRK